MWRINEISRKLLKKVLGYNDDEIRILESENFGRNIANNLTIEQAKDITEIFGDNGFTLYLNNGSGVSGAIAWNQLGISLTHSAPKDHYCNEPLISREHLADLSIPKKIEQPVKGYILDNKPTVECPYCHSTNTKKITTTSKAVHTALFGIFGMSRNSKQWHCNNCNSDF